MTRRKNEGPAGDVVETGIPGPKEQGPDPELRYRRHDTVPNTAGAIVIPVCDRDTVVRVDGETPRFPAVEEFRKLVPDAISGTWHEIAAWRGTTVYSVAVSSRHLDTMQAAQHFERETYRNLFPGVGNIRLALFARAIQIADWASTSLFCPACGARCVPGKDESVSRCPDCGHDQYPRMAPAMIVAVVRNGRLLLARAPRFRGAFHSVLAGFVEPGESVEDCIHREVWEETRVMVKNIRYFGSQSWPFPHSLMLAYTAEWSGGEIQIDSRELEHAAWYAPDELPPVPGELSIAGRLIRWFVETGKPETAP